MKKQKRNTERKEALFNSNTWLKDHFGKSLIWKVTEKMLDPGLLFTTVTPGCDKTIMVFTEDGQKIGQVGVDQSPAHIDTNSVLRVMWHWATFPSISARANDRRFEETVRGALHRLSDQFPGLEPHYIVGKLGGCRSRLILTSPAPGMSIWGTIDRMAA